MVEREESSRSYFVRLSDTTYKTQGHSKAEISLVLYTLSLGCFQGMYLAEKCWSGSSTCKRDWQGEKAVSVYMNSSEMSLLNREQALLIMSQVL